MFQRASSSAPSMRHLVDVGHDAQQAERAGEEVEELHVVDFGVVDRRVHADRAVREVRLEAEFRGLRHFLLVGVVHVGDVVHGLRRADRQESAVRVVAEAEPAVVRVDRVRAAGRVEAAAAESVPVRGEEGEVVGELPVGRELRLQLFERLAAVRNAAGRVRLVDRVCRIDVRRDRIVPDVVDVGEARRLRATTRRVATRCRSARCCSPSGLHCRSAARARVRGCRPRRRPAGRTPRTPCCCSRRRTAGRSGFGPPVGTNALCWKPWFRSQPCDTTT